MAIKLTTPASFSILFGATAPGSTVKPAELVAALKRAPQHTSTEYLQASPKIRGLSRRSFLVASGVGLLSACIKKRKSGPVKMSARQRERARQRAILKEYLSRQKVADTSKVDKIYLKEDVLDNPTLLGDQYSPAAIAWIRHKKDDPMTLSEMKFVQSREARHLRSPIIVLIPASSIPLINGTQSERNTFDSMFYHEVEGHGTDHAYGSEFSKVFTGVYQYFGGHGHRVAVIKPMFDHALEFSAFIKELDRLIVKFDFDQNPYVIEPWAKEAIERGLAQYAINFLKLLDKSSRDPDGVQVLKILEFFNRFLKMRYNSVSPKTRDYTAQLIERQGWHKPIPW